MAEYLIFFNQQWVGDHTEEWFASRAEPARAACQVIADAGHLVFAGGLEEDITQAFSADATSGELEITDGPYTESKEWLGGFALVSVPDEATARHYAGLIAEGCGWPQEVREFKGNPMRP